jgi:hypothetical protein
MKEVGSMTEDMDFVVLLDADSLTRVEAAKALFQGAKNVIIDIIGTRAQVIASSDACVRRKVCGQALGFPQWGECTPRHDRWHRIAAFNERDVATPARSVGTESVRIF